MSPATRLVGFLLLLGLVFLGAHAAGARLGPVTTGHRPPGNEQQSTVPPGNMPGMNMGAPPAWPPQPGSAGTR